MCAHWLHLVQITLFVQYFYLVDSTDVFLHDGTFQVSLYKFKHLNLKSDKDTASKWEFDFSLRFSASTFAWWMIKRISVVI